MENHVVKPVQEQPAGRSSTAPHTPTDWQLAERSVLRGKEQHCRDTQEWRDDCMKWRGRVLTGEQSHWCYDWDNLPVDETTPEWPCGCAQPTPLAKAESRS